MVSQSVSQSLNNSLTHHSLSSVSQSQIGLENKCNTKQYPPQFSGTTDTCTVPVQSRPCWWNSCPPLTNAGTPHCKTPPLMDLSSSREKRGKVVDCHRSEINTKAHERLKERVLLLALVLSSIYSTTQRAERVSLRDKQPETESFFSCLENNCAGYLKRCLTLKCKHLCTVQWTKRSYLIVYVFWSL